MPEFLKKHPFAIEAHFAFSLVVSFAVPVKELQAMLPPCLEADSHNGEWAFVTAAMVQTEALRPKGFPAFLGNDFFLVGYRFFVRYHNKAGKRLRGLYILGSETDKRKMEMLGNVFTHYKYRKLPIQKEIGDNAWRFESPESGFCIDAETGTDIALPASSPFSSWQEARRFAGPLPFTFTWLEKEKKVLIVEGVRENWIPVPLKINKAVLPFIEALGFSETRLANAFIVRDIPYYWKKGRSESWP